MVRIFVRVRTGSRGQLWLAIREPTEYNRRMSVLEIIRAAFEVLVLAFIFYQVYRAYRDSPSATIFIGLIVLVVLGSLLLKLMGAGVLDHLVTVIFAGPGLILVVLFQPEIRSVLAKCSHKILAGRMWSHSDPHSAEFLQNVREAVTYMASRRIGALLVFCRTNRLDDIEHYDQGTPVDAIFTPALVETIFYTGSPLHDGAVIIKRERVASAGAILPVSERNPVDASMGLRHRAAMGIAEKSDAVVVVVSEEKGRITLFYGQKVQQDISVDLLADRLSKLLYYHADDIENQEISDL